jgi:hypothetical protein
MAKPPAGEAPGYVPAGFEFRRRVVGGVTPTLGTDPARVALTYTRGWSHQDWIDGLQVHLAPGTGHQLVATETRSGVPVDLSAEGASAVYHDGWWQIGPGAEEVAWSDTVAHWDRSSVHSLTVTTGERTIAVRGSRASGVGFEELVRVARSLPL